MTFLSRAIFVLWCLASPAWADFPGGAFTNAQTRFGLLNVVGDRGSQRLLFNGADLGVSTHSYEINGVWAIEGGTQDWVVITAYHGGNMCGGFDMMALMITTGQVTRTNSFGICRGAPIDIRVTPDAMELDISDPAPRVAYRTFRFDGVGLSDTPVAEAVAAPAGAGASVTRWLGQHPQRLTQDPSEQARFARVMTPAQMDDLNRRMSGPGGTSQIGDWVVGEACQAHQCNAFGAAWGIRISDGAVLVVFYDGPNVSEVLAGDQQLSGPAVKKMLSRR